LLSVLPFFLLLLWWMGYSVAFTQVLTMYRVYHAWIHLGNGSSSSSSPPIPRVVSTGIIFAFTYMCTHFCTICTILPLFPNTPQHWCQLSPTPGKDLFCLPVLWFCRRKKEKR
jgi:hypothetical protein